MAGYLSLFFDDSKQSIKNISLQDSKDQIYANYKNKFHADMSTRQDFQNIINNTLLGKISSVLDSNSQEMIPYWDVSMGQAMAAINQAQDKTGKIGAALDYIGRVQQDLSIALEQGAGIIPKELSDTLNKAIESLQAVAASFGGKVEEKGFDSALFGAYQGAVRYAQGAIHEAASLVAAFIAQNYVNKELHKANSHFSVMVASTGGTFIESSELAEAASQSNLKLGMSSGNKNDLTIVIQDNGTGKIV